jgi:hypothetical protein
MIDRLFWPKYHLEDFAPYNGQPGQRRHPLKLCSNKGVVIDDVGHLAIAGTYLCLVERGLSFISTHCAVIETILKTSQPHVKLTVKYEKVLVFVKLCNAT